MTHSRQPTCTRAGAIAVSAGDPSGRSGESHPPLISTVVPGLPGCFMTPPFFPPLAVLARFGGLFLSW